MLRAPLIQLKYTLKHWESTFSYSFLRTRFALVHAQAVVPGVQIFFVLKVGVIWSSTWISVICQGIWASQKLSRGALLDPSELQDAYNVI